jgi:hypothetical protein
MNSIRSSAQQVANKPVPHPIFVAWADRFGFELGIGLRYVPSGSGAGLPPARNLGADFGGSDRPLLRKEVVDTDLEHADGGFATWQAVHGDTADEWALLTRSRILIARGAALAQRSAAVARFVRHCLLHGGDLTALVGLVPLLNDVRDANVAQLERVLCRG